MREIEKMMQQAVDDGVFPGGVLLVSTANSIVFFEAYGVADTFSMRTMARDTVFDLASLTKPLATTLSVMNLVVQGKLALEHRLGSILPAFKGTDKSGITVKHLMGRETVYSDLGFMILGWMVEHLSGRRLDRFVAEEI